MKLTLEESRQQAVDAAKAAAAVARIRTSSIEREKRRETWREKWAKIKTFIEAVTGPLARDETVISRLVVCDTCPSLKRHEGGLYCNACGCGQWKLAELHTKLRFANLECPLGKWGKEV